MSWWSKVFGGRGERGHRGSKKRAVWIPASENPFGVPVLDLIGVTGGMISTSQDPSAAALAVSWSSKLIGELRVDFAPTKSFPCDLHYTADVDLPDGWLFTPSTMEQKWVIAFRGGDVLMIRSWTGAVVVAGKTRHQGDQLVIERIDLADEAFAVFGEPIPTFDWMLRAHALGQSLPLPVNEASAQILEALPLSVFGSFGNVAACAATTWAPSPAPRPLRSTSDVVLATRLERADRIADLVARGTSVNARAAFEGFTPLHVAAVKGHMGLTKQLLDLGANPDVLADRDATVLATAMVFAAPLELMKLLVARGADPRVVNVDGFGLLHAVAEVNRPEALGWLLSLGLDIEARTKRGYTPLHVAAGLGHVEALEALLDAGADVEAREPSGKTARDIAQAEGNKKALGALARRSS